MPFHHPFFLKAKAAALNGGAIPTLDEQQTAIRELINELIAVSLLIAGSNRERQQTLAEIIIDMFITEYTTKAKLITELTAALAAQDALDKASTK